MKKTVFVLSIILIFITAVRSQHYITPALGYGISFAKSDDLELFKDWYNTINGERGISTYFKGLGNPVGLRAQIGYRHFGKWSSYAAIGYQNMVSKDYAIYFDKSSRNLVLSMKSIFVEGGVGPRIKNLFFNGLLTVYIHRNVILESKYAGPPDPEGRAFPLNGEYRVDNTMAADFGIIFGIHKEPVVISAKITYPLFTGGGNEVLTDDSLQKVKAGTSIFPDDYDNYLYGEPFKGIAADIDGIKIIVTLAVALQIRE